jgi:signal transduction histidine kinase
MLLISYAIVKHRLMDINVVIRKTLLYSLISAALAAIYVGTITLLAHLFGGLHGSTSAFSSALAAVFITVLFNPLRVKMQRFVDRHFFRESLDQAILREATSGFVHEIKRPLANISLPAELSLMDLQDWKEKRLSFEEVAPKIEQRLRYILNQTADAGDKIEAIRAYSSTNGKSLESVNLSEVIRKCISAQELLLKRHRIELDLDLLENIPPIQGHGKQLEIAFSNLLKNAAEAMSQLEPLAQRWIQLKVNPIAEKIMITVKDSGPGIKRENLEHLFEPYFTTKGSQGMGMGLYLSQQIIKAHGGIITVASIKGGGAEFAVELPLTIL